MRSSTKALSAREIEDERIRFRSCAELEPLCGVPRKNIDFILAAREPYSGSRLAIKYAYSGDRVNMANCRHSRLETRLFCDQAAHAMGHNDDRCLPRLLC
jgi:hypothetical protein